VLPTQVGPITLASQGVTLDQFLEFQPDAFGTGFGTLLAGLGRSSADVSTAEAHGSDVQGSEVISVQAFRVAGADSQSFLDGFVELWRQFEADGSVATPMTIAGKEVIALGATTTEAQYKTYFYAAGDIVFRVGYNGDKFDERMADMFTQLP
jgi:hypothetical protein